MKRIVYTPALMLLGLAACDRPQSRLFAEQTVAVVAPPASAETAPHFVGRWAPTADQCADPWVIEARSLARDDVSCEFDKVDASSAGYAVASTCRVDGKLQPVRLNVILPNPEKAQSLTISGGPFTDALALQRCAAQH